MLGHLPRISPASRPPEDADLAGPMKQDSAAETGAIHLIDNEGLISLDDGMLMVRIAAGEERRMRLAKIAQISYCARCPRAQNSIAQPVLLRRRLCGRSSMGDMIVGVCCWNIYNFDRLKGLLTGMLRGASVGLMFMRGGKRAYQFTAGFVVENPAGGTRLATRLSHTGEHS